MENLNTQDSKELIEFKKISYNANKIILMFLKDKFHDKPGFDHFYSNIESKLNNLQYDYDENLQAAASYNSISNLVTFSNGYHFDLKNLGTDEITKIMAIYFHEISHLISNYIIMQGRSYRIEEGIADLFSDVLIDFIDEKNLLGDNFSCNYKLTTYSQPASIVRCIAIANNNHFDLLWSYFSESNEKDIYETDFFKVISDVIGNQNAIKFITNEFFSDICDITENECNILKEAIKDIDITHIPSILIHNNLVYHDIILKKLKSENLYNPDVIKEIYPNIPESFYQKHKLLLTDLNRLKEETIASHGSEEFEQNVNNLVNRFFEVNDIENLKDLDSNGFYKNYAINNILKFLKQNELFDYNLEFGVLFPLLINYELLRKHKQLDINEYSKTVGKIINPNLDEFLFNSVIKTVEHQYHILKDYSEDTMFDEIKNILSQNIKNICEFESNKLNYENGNIDDTQLINALNKSFFEASKNKLNYPTGLIKKYLKIIITNQFKNDKQLDKKKIDELSKCLQSIVDQYDIPYKYDIKSLVIKNSFKNEPCLSDFLNILNDEKLTIIDNNIFDEILSQAAFDSNEKFSIDELKEFLNIFCDENFNFNNEKLLVRDPSRKYFYQEKLLMQGIKSNIINQCIDLYTDGNEEINTLFNSNEKYWDFAYRNIDTTTSNKTANKLILHELSFIPNFELEKIKDLENISINNILAIIYNKPSFFLSPKDVFKKLENTPYLSHLYYNTLLPMKPIDISKRFFSIDGDVEKYLEYKDAVPKLAEAWKNYILESINQYIQVDDDIVYDGYSCHQMAHFIEDSLHYDETLKEELFGSNYDLIIYKSVNILNKNLLLERENDYSLDSCKKLIQQLEQEYHLGFCIPNYSKK